MSEEIELKNFENRVSSNPNRRKLTIISQSPTEIIADIERADENVTKEGTKIDASGLQNIIDKVNDLEDKLGEAAGTFVYVGNEFKTELSFSSDPQTQITNEATTRANFDTSLQAQINNITNNSSKISNVNGGFASGKFSNAGIGGAIGQSAGSTAGFAGGYYSSTTIGGAVGQSATSLDGFAGGYEAHANANNSIQLGTGTNNTANSLQVFSWPVLDAAGNINAERIQHFFTGNVNYPDLIIGKNLSNNGYIKFKSGLIIQWGARTRSSSSGDYTDTCTLPTAFSNTNYKISLTANKNSSNTTYRVIDPTILTKSTTSFFYGAYGNSQVWTIDWIAIGY